MPNFAREPLLTPTLIKAARALLGWDQVALAEHAGVSRKTISLIEAATEAPSDPRRIAVIVELKALLEEAMGVRFEFEGPRNGEGVRLVRPRPRATSRK